MPRSRADGTPARPPRRRRLTPRIVRSIKPEPTAFSIWDTHTRGLALHVVPTGGRSWKYVYSRGGRSRWLHIGRADAITLAAARRIAADHAAAVANGGDPVAEGRARGAGTFGEVAARYVDEHAKRKNKSWRQADELVRRYLLPRWGNLDVRAITRADVRRLVGAIAAPVLANLVLASASAIFSWAIKQDVVATNPCTGVERNEVRSRERVLSDAEVPLFWRAFDDAGLIRSAALKLILLSGARPGEAAHMRREHVKDGWWRQPGEADANWPGTKNANSHDVWLAPAARAIVDELMDGEAPTGFVFATDGGGPVTDLSGAMRAICKRLDVPRATPHDLRRSFATRAAALGFDRHTLGRLLNHVDPGVIARYDRHRYQRENVRAWEAVAAHVVGLATGEPLVGGNVVRMGA